MQFPTRFSTFAAIFGGLILGAGSLRADTFDWNNITYSPGGAAATTATPTYTGRPAGSPNSTGSTNTLSLNIVLTNGATFSTGATSPISASYDDNNTYYTSGGGATSQRSLQLVADFANATQYIKVTVVFAKPVTNVSFNFFDVDSGTVNNGQYQDQIRTVQGLGTNGTTLYDATFSNTNSTTNTVDNAAHTATAIAVSGTSSAASNSGAGNVAASFGNNQITQFSFIYGDAIPGTTAHSAVQLIGFSNITFTNVPEPGTLALVGLGLAGAAGLAIRRK